MRRIEKDWYACDRCGRKIEREYPIGVSFLRRIFCKPTELEVLKTKRFGFLDDMELSIPEIVSVEIREYYGEETETIHLCGECRKAFERFLKNE